MSEEYAKIGGHYNRTRKADKFLIERIYHHLAPMDGGRYLDIGCGTGNYTIALSEKGLNFIGVDPSREMLRQAEAGKKEIG